jgi:hypothetical protein
VILRSERVLHAVVPTYEIVRRLLIHGVAAAIMEGEEGLGGWGATPVEGEGSEMGVQFDWRRPSRPLVLAW